MNSHVALDQTETGSGRGKRFITSILVDPVEKEVHRADFGDLMIVSVKPQHLLTAEVHRRVLSQDGGAVVPKS